MTTEQYLANASVYERQAIEMLRQQGNTMVLCKVLYKDGDCRWTAKTAEEAKKNIANYDPRYHRTTGYYNIVETLEIKR